MTPLIDPTRDELARALAAAGCRRAKAEAERALTAMRDAPQGRLPSPPKARRLMMTWWSDHRGRRHVTAEPSTPPEHPWQEEPAWPPLGRIYPGVLFRIDRPGEPLRCVVLCRCGVCGPPESVGWMGDRCGPCHDRGVDGSPADEEYPAVAPMGEHVGWLAWRAGGRSVYTSVSGGDGFRRLDLDGGGWRPSADWAGVRTFTHQELVPSPADPCLVARHHTGMSEIQLLDHAGVVRQALPVPDGPGTGRLAFSAGGGVLAFAGGVSGWRVFRSEGGAFREAVRRDQFASDVAVSPDGGLVALWGSGAGEVRIADAGDGRTVRVLDVGRRAGRLGGWVLDGQHLLILPSEHSPGSPEVWDVSRAARLTEVPIRGQHAAVTPCGRYLLWRRNHNPALPLCDLRTGGVVAMLTADQKAWVTAFAFSPDGVWLALADTGMNLRVVRWGPLLDAVLAGG